ncbi:MAG: hypothetical protein IJ068_05545 [Bacilli bacterium]|nr:hypothetical protein [Bacilli bacterium]
MKNNYYSTNEMIENVSKKMEKNITDFEKTYKGIYKDLDELTSTINNNMDCLLRSDVYNLIKHIEKILQRENSEPILKENTNSINNLKVTYLALKNKLQDLFKSDNREYCYKNVDYTSPNYIDFANFIYNTLSHKFTYEEKKIIEDKLEELNNRIEANTMPEYYSNAFCEMKY